MSAARTCHFCFAALPSRFAGVTERHGAASLKEGLSLRGSSLPNKCELGWAEPVTWVTLKGPGVAEEVAVVGGTCHELSWSSLGHRDTLPSPKARRGLQLRQSSACPPPGLW